MKIVENCDESTKITLLSVKSFKFDFHTLIILIYLGPGIVKFLYTF